jgi:hypothetical protein
VLLRIRSQRYLLDGSHDDNILSLQSNLTIRVGDDRVNVPPGR